MPADGSVIVLAKVPLLASRVALPRLTEPALELALNVTVPETANSVPEVSEIWPKIGTATFGVADPCKCKEEKNESLFVMVSRKSPEVLGLKLESPG